MGGHVDEWAAVTFGLVLGAEFLQDGLELLLLRHHGLALLQQRFVLSGLLGELNLRLLQAQGFG